MVEAILLVVGGLVGAGLTYLVRRRLHHEQRPRKRLRCQSTYCLDLLADSATTLSDTVELRVDGQVLDSPIVINYTLESIGNEAITDCRVQICTRQSDQIVRAQVLVQSELQCERISFQEESPTRLKLTWSHINPGDMIIIALLVSPCQDARCVRLEVDAEGLELENRPMQADCSVEVPGDLHRAEPD